MSRTSEQTLPNVMLEKGLFDDLKVLDLLETFGCLGFTVYVSLLFKIADDKGYYTQMTPSLVVSIQRDIGSKWVSREKVIEVINFLAQCDLISSNLLEKGVLTSVGIQRRYLSVKRKSRSKGFSTEKYWLLDESQADNPIEYNKDEIERNKADKCNIKTDKCNNNSDIKIKGRKSENEDEEYTREIQILLGNVVFDCKPIHTREEYAKAKDALNKSSWARNNLTHLSKIHRVWDRLISGYYNDGKVTSVAQQFMSRNGCDEFGTLNDEEI